MSNNHERRESLLPRRRNSFVSSPTQSRQPRRYSRKKHLRSKDETESRRLRPSHRLNDTLTQTYVQSNSKHDDEALTNIVGHILQTKRLRNELLYDLDIFSTGSGLSRMHGSSRNNSLEHHGNLLFAGHNKRRKDFIPKPFTSKQGVLARRQRKKSEVYFQNRPNFLPESYRDEEMPLNALYTSMQGLDTKEQRLLKGFLDAERLEEKHGFERGRSEDDAYKDNIVSAEDIPSDVQLYADLDGNLYGGRASNEEEDITQKEIDSLKNQENELIAFIHDKVRAEKARQTTIKRLEASKSRLHKTAAPAPQHVALQDALTHMPTTRRNSNVSTFLDVATTSIAREQPSQVKFETSLFQDALYEKTTESQELISDRASYTPKLPRNASASNEGDFHDEESSEGSASIRSPNDRKNIHDVTASKKQLAQYQRPIPPPGYAHSGVRSPDRKLSVIVDVITDDASSVVNGSAGPHASLASHLQPQQAQAVIGAKRQAPNEFTFGSNVQISPGTNPNNIKIVHESPPSEFRAAFQTMLPPTRKPTLFTLSLLQDNQPTNQQLSLEGFSRPFPWQWYKNQSSSPTSARYGDDQYQAATRQPPTTKHSPAASTFYSPSPATAITKDYLSALPTTRPSRPSTPLHPRYSPSSGDSAPSGTSIESQVVGRLNSYKEKLHFNLPHLVKRPSNSEMNSTSFGYADGEIILGTQHPFLNVSQIHLPVNMVHVSDQPRKDKETAVVHHPNALKVKNKEFGDNAEDISKSKEGNAQPSIISSTTKEEHTSASKQQVQPDPFPQDLLVPVDEKNISGPNNDPSKQRKLSDNQEGYSRPQINSVKFIDLTTYPPVSFRATPQASTAEVEFARDTKNTSVVTLPKASVKILSQGPLSSEMTSAQHETKAAQLHIPEEQLHLAREIQEDIHIENKSELRPKPGFELPVLAGPTTKDYNSFLPGVREFVQSKGHLRSSLTAKMNGGDSRGRFSKRRMHGRRHFSRLRERKKETADVSGDRRQLSYFNQYSSFTRQEMNEGLQSASKLHDEVRDPERYQGAPRDRYALARHRGISAQPSELNDERPIIHFVDYINGMNSKDSSSANSNTADDNARSASMEAESTLQNHISGDAYTRPEVQLFRFVNESKPHQTEVSAKVDGIDSVPIIYASDDQEGILSSTPESLTSVSNETSAQNPNKFEDPSHSAHKALVKKEQSSPPETSIQTEDGSGIAAVALPLASVKDKAPKENTPGLREHVRAAPTISPVVHYPTINLEEIKKNLRRKLVILNHMQENSASGPNPTNRDSLQPIMQISEPKPVASQGVKDQPDSAESAQEMILKSIQAGRVDQTTSYNATRKGGAQQESALNSQAEPVTPYSRTTEEQAQQNAVKLEAYSASTENARHNTQISDNTLIPPASASRGENTEKAMQSQADVSPGPRPQYSPDVQTSSIYEDVQSRLQGVSQNSKVVATANYNSSEVEHQIYTDDMYWTDSDEEKELACRQQKRTDIVMNILCFGDSLTRGYYNKGKSHHPYTMKLQYLLNQLDPKRCFIVDNEGKDGDLAFGEMPKRIDSILKEPGRQFAWVVILGGTNDIYNKKHAGQHSAAEITQNIVAVHEIAHKHGSRTMAVTIPEVYCESTDTCQDMKVVRETVNDNIRTFAMNNKQNVILCDLAGLLARNKISQALVGQFFEGGLHLKPRGYETMARLIFNELKTAVD